PGGVGLPDHPGHNSTPPTRGQGEVPSQTSSLFRLFGGVAPPPQVDWSQVSTVAAPLCSIYARLDVTSRDVATASRGRMRCENREVEWVTTGGKGYSCPTAVRMRQHAADACPPSQSSPSPGPIPTTPNHLPGVGWNMTADVMSLSAYFCLSSRNTDSREEEAMR